MKIKKIILIGLCLIFGGVSMYGCTSAEIQYDYTKKLSDNDKVLTNPGMGWDFAYYANSLSAYGNTLKDGDYLDDFPCDIVYFRLGWSDIEPEEGKFNWELIDKVANEWIARGKRIAFRWCSVFPGYQDTPLWVKEKGAKGVEYNLNEVSRMLLGYDFYSDIYDKTFIAYYDDPVYLEELEKFLTVCAERYDGKDYVEFIDVGSLGSWGEGNSHGSWIGNFVEKDGNTSFVMDITKMPEGNFDLVETHLRLWRKCFPNTRLFANDDMMGTAGDRFYDLIEELQMGLNDDSVQTGTQYEKMVNSKATARVWQDRCISIEHHPTTIPTNVYYQSLLESHASYARIHMNPYVMADSNFTKQMSKKLGYRIVCSQVDFTELAAGKTFNAKITLKNTVAAPCYLNGYPTISVVDENGNIVASGKSDFNIKDLTVECHHDNCLMYGGIAAHDAEPAEALVKFDVPSGLKSGTYYICLSVSDDKNEAGYNLPLNNEMSDLGLNKMYKLASFAI